MQRARSVVALSLVLAWIASTQAQTITETVSPSGPVVIVVFTSSDKQPATLTTISTLTGHFSSNAAKPTPSRSSTSDSDPDLPHISSPVAMVAGILAGTIAVVAAILVFCVVRRRRNGKMRRRGSIIRAFEAEHAGSVRDPTEPTTHAGGEEDGFRESEFSGDSQSLRGITLVIGKNRHGRSIHPPSSYQPSSRARTNSSRQEVVELDWRDSSWSDCRSSIPSSRIGGGESNLPQIQTPLSPTSTLNTTTATATTKTSPGTSNSKSSSDETHHRAQLHSPTPLAFLPALRSTTAEPSLATSPHSQDDLPPAYDDVR